MLCRRCWGGATISFYWRWRWRRRFPRNIRRITRITRIEVAARALRVCAPTCAPARAPSPPPPLTTPAFPPATRRSRRIRVAVRWRVLHLRRRWRLRVPVRYQRPATPIPLLPCPVDYANAPLESDREDGGAALGKNSGGGNDDRDGRSRMGSNPARYVHHTCVTCAYKAAWKVAGQRPASGVERRPRCQVCLRPRCRWQSKQGGGRMRRRRGRSRRFEGGRRWPAAK